MTGSVNLRDVFFDDPAAAAEAISAAVLGRPGGIGDVLRRMPEATRAGALTRFTEAAEGLLTQDVTEVFCAGWSRHRDIRAAALESLADPEAKRTVGLAAHTLALNHEPSIELRFGQQKLATVSLQIHLEAVIRSLQVTVRAGRLVAVGAGTCDVGGTLGVGGVTVAQRQRPLSLLLPLTVHLGNGWPLVDGA
ncbi:hypothetical protein [Actinoplanes sp. NPDC051851]|uniref:hypothetical protein n=1 Tax=Actinoplanes sp. NPDC051851 TaxID=3154753 RepID=UPI00343C2194